MQTEPLHAFDTLDAVQRYALGALAVVLLHRHTSDMNGTAFARTQSLLILDALNLRSGQQHAILALDPSDETRDEVVAQCVNLVGELPDRFRALQAMLALSVISGSYDARSRVFLSSVALHFGVAWPAVAAVELALAVHLLQSQSPNSNAVQTKQLIDVDQHIAPYFSPQPVDDDSHGAISKANSSSYSEQPCVDVQTQNEDGVPPQSVGNPFASPSTEIGPISIVSDSIYNVDENANENTSDNDKEAQSFPSVDQLKTERRKKKQRVRKAMKIGGITLVGGVLFGLTGGLIAPALLTALAGVGVTSAAGLAASGSLASGAVVGGLFGVAGGGFTLRKARNRVKTNLEEFDFERPDDPRVIAERERKAEKAQKSQKLLESNEKYLAIEDVSVNGSVHTNSTTVNIEDDTISGSVDDDNDEGGDINVEKELPPPESSPSPDTENDDKQSQKRGNGKVKKQKKVKAGARGLEALANVPSLHLCICVPAWLSDRGYGSALEQFEPGLEAELPYSQHVAVRWESTRLYEMGLAFAKFWASKATVSTIQQAYPHALAAASSVAGAVAFAFAIPLTVMSCMDYIDNPWSILVSRSNGAGEELADILVEQSFGRRPVTLYGYSIGARVIFKALECLAARSAHGIVQDVFLIGAPVSADPERWRKIRPVVAGRIVNAYGSYDWALAFLHRGCGHGVYVSGLRKVEDPTIENLNLAYLGIEGHQELKDSLGRAMHAMGIGLGYITMPPAKLVIKGHRTGISGSREQKVVCEEPGGAEWARDPEDPELNSGDDEDEENGKTVVNENGNIDGDASAESSSFTSSTSSEAKSKRKSKKRRSWGWWYGNGSSKSSVATGSKVEKSDAVRPELTSNEVVKTEAGYGTSEREAVDKEFDWDLQRSIWEEQERQINERGFEYADSARVVELRGKLMMSVSIEVAGRRLEMFLERDSSFPVRQRTQIFTNCVDNQRGMQLRVYEHDPRVKSVSINMHKWRKRHKYPKELAAVELRLRECKPKGSLRVQVGLQADEDGNIHISAQEIFGDANEAIGERISAIVEFSQLCTPEERVEMEAAERRRKSERETAEQLRADSQRLALTQGEDVGTGNDRATCNGAAPITQTINSRQLGGNV